MGATSCLGDFYRSADAGAPASATGIYLRRRNSRRRNLGGDGLDRRRGAKESVAPNVSSFDCFPCQSLPADSIFAAGPLALDTDFFVLDIFVGQGSRLFEPEFVSCPGPGAASASLSRRRNSSRSRAASLPALRLKIALHCVADLDQPHLARISRESLLPRATGPTPDLPQFAACAPEKHIH